MKKENDRYEISKWVEALGILSTIKGDMIIDVDDPVGMAKQILEHVRQMEDRLKKLENPNLDYS